VNGDTDDTGAEDVLAEDVLEVPGFAAGGRVERTGIALVHEGEYVVPAAGSAAVISPAAEAAVINYYFPVQVEVVGSLPDTEVQRLAGYVFDQLDRELATRI
jgi:hypothetical protein